MCIILTIISSTHFIHCIYLFILVAFEFTPELHFAAMGESHIYIYECLHTLVLLFISALFHFSLSLSLFLYHYLSSSLPLSLIMVSVSVGGSRWRGA